MSDDLEDLIARQKPKTQAALRHALRVASGIEAPAPSVPSALETLVEVGAEAAKGFPPAGPLIAEGLTALLSILRHYEEEEARAAAKLGSAAGMAAWIASHNAGKKR